MVVNITTIHFHYQVVTILGSDVHFNSSDVHYSVFTVYETKLLEFGVGGANLEWVEQIWSGWSGCGENSVEST